MVLKVQSVPTQSWTFTEKQCLTLINIHGNTKFLSLLASASKRMSYPGTTLTVLNDFVLLNRQKDYDIKDGFQIKKFSMKKRDYL